MALRVLIWQRVANDIRYGTTKINDVFTENMCFGQTKPVVEIAWPPFFDAFNPHYQTTIRQLSDNYQTTIKQLSDN